MATHEYLVADTLGIALNKKNGRLSGADRKAYGFGPWSVDLWMQAVSDVNTPSECAMWVSLTKRLWLYLTVSARKTYLLVFDAYESGIDFAVVADCPGKSSAASIDIIRPAVKAVFEYRSETEKWSQVSDNCLDKLTKE